MTRRDDNHIARPDPTRVTGGPDWPWWYQPILVVGIVAFVMLVGILLSGGAR